MSELPAQDVRALLEELTRIVSVQAEDLGAYFLLLPIVSESEALDFLRSVPAGASLDTIREMAVRYRIEHGTGQNFLADNSED